MSGTAALKLKDRVPVVSSCSQPRNLSMLFARRRPEPLPEAAHMGFRSRLFLEKLGFELRERCGAPDEMPPEIGRLAERLDPDRVVRMPRRDSDELRRFTEGSFLSET